MTKLLIDSHYLPCLDYFYEITLHEEIYIEAHENYQKQTYRNRCEILGANKVDILTVPVMKTGQKVLMRDVRIDYSQRWQRIHWRAMESAYGNSPYFEYYAPYYKEILFKEQELLLDLNLDLVTLCLKLLNFNRKIHLTEQWKKGVEKDFSDLRSKIQPKKASNTLINHWPQYRQVFGSNFVSNLSIIDLLFNIGPEAGTFLKEGKSQQAEQL